MAQEESTNIFISYRREGGRDIARTVKLGLESLGYENIFFDYNSIRDGVFNEQIITAIEHCKDFILILSEGALDRCSNEDDWVSREIRTALAAGCKIIPVKINQGEWKWPEGFPKDLAVLKSIQFATLLTDEYFDDSIRRITERLDTLPSKTEQKKESTGNPFIDYCIEKIDAGETEFEFVYRDNTFKILPSSLYEFVLKLCNCPNKTEIIKQRLSNLQEMSEEVIYDSLRRYKPMGFGDFLPEAGPRFVLRINDKAVVVRNTGGFKEDAILTTHELDGFCTEYLLTREICIKALQEMIDNPFAVRAKSAKQSDNDDYVNYYLKTLEQLFRDGAYRIHFKPNPQYNCDPRKVYYIGYTDMYSNKFTIREGKDFNTHDDDNDPIIAQYNTAEATLRDGWELD